MPQHQASSQANSLGNIELMFKQIMEVVHKSVRRYTHGGN